MAFRVQLRVDNLEEVQVNLPFWISLWRIRTRAELERWGFVLSILAVAKSPQDKLRGVDARRRPISRSLSRMWRYEVDTAGDDPLLNVGNIDPKMQFILFPTKGGKKITPKGDYPLRFYDARAGGPFFRWSVKKGKTEGQPVHLWALDAFNLDSRVKDLANRLVQ